jgi:hypothetical protein
MQLNGMSDAMKRDGFGITSACSFEDVLPCFVGG